MTRARDLADSADKDIAGTLTLDGLVVDDITIDGSTISDGGDFTIDSGGDIILDANGADWKFKDDGTDVLNIENSSGDIKITSITNDKDIIFRGVDNGSAITALTLDMSAAGEAKFHRPRSNTAGDCAITVDPSDTTVEYGFRIDNANNAFNIDRVDNTTNLLSISATGDVGIGVSTVGNPGWARNVHIHGSGNGGGLKLTDNTSGSGNDDGLDIASYQGHAFFINRENATMRFHTNDAEKARLDADGHFYVGTTDSQPPTNNDASGICLRADGKVAASRSNGISGDFNIGQDGDIVWFRKSGTVAGQIGTANGGDLYIGNDDTALLFAGGSDAVLPRGTAGAARDNAIDLGGSAHRFDDIYATNGTIQTSDRNEKQDIEELTDAEQRVAVAAKGLLRKFRWKDAVAEKGDKARTHFGIIAQDLQAAFEAEGLDAGDYAMFISSTWTDEETGEERTRMGVRYSELLAFIIAAI